ncbi:MAG: type II toxin-antitoxin system VapC family toxin [Nitrososphaerales archaeon]
MADAGRDQKYLGIDTNVLVAYLDVGHPDHNETRMLIKRKIALNPTVIHEAYHTLVYKMKWEEEEASEVLKTAATDEGSLFINQSMKTTTTSLDIATEYHLGGRDSLIVANFLYGGVQECVTLDGKLLEIGVIKHGRRSVTFKRP